jgi:peroxiredoxin
MPDNMTTPAVGQAIADIPVLAADGSASRLLSEIAGHGRAVLFFMRAADCPVCVAHARVLARLAQAGDLGGAKVLVIAPGGVDAARLAVRRIGSPAIEVRASGTHHSDLGLGRFLGVQHSGTFVTSGTGEVLSAVTSMLPTGSFSKVKVLAALA